MDELLADFHSCSLLAFLAPHLSLTVDVVDAVCYFSNLLWFCSKRTLNVRLFESRRFDYCVSMPYVYSLIR